MIVLDLAVWTLGAELVHGSGRTVHDLDSLAALLSDVLGRGGRVLFYLGVFAAVFTSIVGHAVGLGIDRGPRLSALADRHKSGAARPIRAGKTSTGSWCSGC